MDFGIGIAIQWFMRANSHVPDWLSAIVIVAGASLALWLSPAFDAVKDVRSFAVALVPFITHIATGVLGTSMAANVAVSAGASANHPLVPVSAKP